MLAAVSNDDIAVGPVDSCGEEPNRAPTMVGIKAAYNP